MESFWKERASLMATTRVDRAGRLVIPLDLRRALRLEEGGEVELVLSPEGVSIRRVAPEPSVTLEDGLPVVSLGGPVVSNESVLDLIDQDRGVQ